MVVKNKDQVSWLGKSFIGKFIMQFLRNSMKSAEKATLLLIREVS